MRELATNSVPVGLASRPFAFAASASEFQQLTDSFDGGFILWADTENVLTRTFVVGPLMAREAGLSTAFTIVKKTAGDHDYDARDLVMDECETLAWQFLHQIQKDSEPGNQCPPLITMIDTSSITIDRDGPYTNEHYGVTVQLTIHIRNAIPQPDINLWSSQVITTQP